MSKFTNTIFKLRWYFIRTIHKVNSYIKFWTTIAIVGLGIAFYQLMVGHNICPALMIIGNSDWDAVYQDLAISYIGGSILWMLTALIPDEVRKGHLHKQFKRQISELYKEIWCELSKYTRDGRKIYWRPLTWLGYRMPTFNKTLQVILLEIQWNLVFTSEYINGGLAKRINEIYYIYSDALTSHQRRDIENSLKMLRKLSSKNRYYENNNYFSEALILLYNLGH